VSRSAPAPDTRIISVEIIAAEQGRRALGIFLGHEQKGLLRADCELARPHVVARRLAFIEGLPDLLFEAFFGLLEIGADHHGKPDTHADALGIDLCYRQPGNGLT
jgi:hypothetical protein